MRGLRWQRSGGAGHGGPTKRAGLDTHHQALNGRGCSPTAQRGAPALYAGSIQAPSQPCKQGTQRQCGTQTHLAAQTAYLHHRHCCCDHTGTLREASAPADCWMRCVPVCDGKPECAHLPGWGACLSREFDCLLLPPVWFRCSCPLHCPQGMLAWCLTAAREDCEPRVECCRLKCRLMPSILCCLYWQQCFFCTCELLL